MLQNLSDFVTSCLRGIISFATKALRHKGSQKHKTKTQYFNMLFSLQEHAKLQFFIKTPSV